MSVSQRNTTVTQNISLVVKGTQADLVEFDGKRYYVEMLEVPS